MCILPQAACPHKFCTGNQEDSALFWVFAAILAISCALALGLPFLRPRSVPASRSEHDVESFRAQLREVDSDLARGVLTDAEADAARIELSRRLLAAAEEAEVDAGSKPIPRTLGSTLGMIAAIGVPVIGLGVYGSIGSPSVGDKPLSERNFDSERAAVRPSQEDLEAEYAKQDRGSPPPSQARAQMLDLTEKVKARLATEPDDPRGWDVLARSLMSLEMFDESWRAFEKVAELEPEAADASLYSNMTEAMYMAAGGVMSPKAEVAIDKALAKDPDYHQAIFLKSIALAQRNKTREAIQGWIKMLETAPPGAPWIEQVQDNVRNAAAQINVIPPADLVPRGPTAEQRAAAEELSPEDQQAMVGAMVEGLAQRLEEEPNDLRGWLMLIRSYQILEREEDAKAAQARGLEVFDGDEAATAQLESAL